MQMLVTLFVILLLGLLAAWLWSRRGTGPDLFRNDRPQASQQDEELLWDMVDYLEHDIDDFFGPA